MEPCIVRILHSADYFNFWILLRTIQGITVYSKSVDSIVNTLSLVNCTTTSNGNETIFIAEKKQKKLKLNNKPNRNYDKSIQQAIIDKKLDSKQIKQTEYEEKSKSLFHTRKYYSHHTKGSQAQRRSKYSQPILRKTSTKPAGETELRNSALASSKYGLTVILNPKEAEYTDALKNNYIGFKTLVHTPYNFPEVDAVGMAMGKNVKATVGIRGHHSWITDGANALGLYQKKCLSRSDDIKKYSEVKLEVFAKYTKKGCILECHANIFYNTCGCLPYHYPDFSAVWNKTTNCNHTALQCISKLVGKICF